MWYPICFVLNRAYTGRMGWMAHRKWKKIKLQPSMLPGPAVPGSCLASFHFRWGIHPIRPVVAWHDCDCSRLKPNKSDFRAQVEAILFSELLTSVVSEAGLKQYCLAIMKLLLVITLKGSLLYWVNFVVWKPGEVDQIKFNLSRVFGDLEVKLNANIS